MTFDPDAAAEFAGIYGLPATVEESRFVVVPVPFDATTSYRDGTRNGPAAILEASYQIDLFDAEFGKPYRQGIAMLDLASGTPAKIAKLNSDARKFAEPVIAAGGRVKGKPRLEKALEEVNRRSEKVNELVRETVAGLLEKGKMPIVLGGDHSTPFGAIQAYAARHPGMGILHFDAHADLRKAFEGFVWSHASIMYNVVKRIPGLAALVQVGIRDLGEREDEMIRTSASPKITTHFDAALSAAKHSGKPWRAIADEIVAGLPADVYVSFDIDGLDPQLCPDTGTPVPGGLSFREVVEVLHALVRARKRIVGLDLNEVAPSPRVRKSDWGADWNANVGARLLYKMIGAAAQ